jgi:hypothetical protein
LFNAGQHRRMVASKVGAVRIKLRFDDWHADCSCANGLVLNLRRGLLGSPSGINPPDHSSTQHDGHFFS